MQHPFAFCVRLYVRGQLRVLVCFRRPAVGTQHYKRMRKWSNTERERGDEEQRASHHSYTVLPRFVAAPNSRLLNHAPSQFNNVAKKPMRGSRCCVHWSPVSVIQQTGRTMGASERKHPGNASVIAHRVDDACRSVVKFTSPEHRRLLPLCFAVVVFVSYDLHIVGTGGDNA